RQASPLDQGLDVGVESSEFGLPLAQVQGLQPASLPVESVQLRRQLGHPAGADVLADDAAVDLPAASVVPALGPAHFLLPPSVCPASILPSSRPTPVVPRRCGKPPRQPPSHSYRILSHT